MLAWVSAHIYYQNLDQLLVSCVSPVVEYLLKEHLLQKFFFIRYYDTGMHLRLRIKCNPSNLPIIQEILTLEVRRYLDQVPSVNSQLKSGPGSGQTVDEIRFIEYEMEKNRYGGNLGMVLAQDMFQASSRQVISLLSQRKLTTYSEKMGTALTSHFVLVYAFRFCLTEASSFFRSVYHQWLPSAMVYINKSTSKASSKNHLETNFENQYTERREMLLEYFSSINSHLSGDTEFEDETLKDWIQNCKDIADSYSFHQKKGQIDFQKASVTTGYFSPNAICSILHSHIHMNNNRFGISNKDEAYLSFLLAQITKDISCKYNAD